MTSAVDGLVLRLNICEALRPSAENTERLKDTLAPFGFQRSDLKPLRFDIDTRYESDRDKGEYRQRFVGYQFQHTLKVAFNSDNERLGKAVTDAKEKAMCADGAVGSGFELDIEPDDIEMTDTVTVVWEIA